MAKSVRVVPAGNRLQKQPKIPTSSSLRTSAQKTSFDKKYEKIKTLLQSDKKLISKIKKIADVYDIEPIHMIGAMVGEHTYNINVFDHLQTYYTKAAIYSGMRIRFAYDGENIEDFLKREQFESCKDVKDSYDLWNCRQAIWKKGFSRQDSRRKGFSERSVQQDFLSAPLCGPDLWSGSDQPSDRAKAH
ncbi:DUF1402 family protein [uncultured Cohaesibacter sp.]|uniref:DUF1402 family protein n=1 Tax=uncultured Cohaesibacter sp. TaxID=1002546 RepID=UPI002930C9B6